MADIVDVGGILPVAANSITNMEVKTVFADNATVGTSYELLSNLDADPTQLGTAGDGIEVVGSSTDDDGSPAGTGANTIKVRGLDTSFNIKEATLTLNGTTAVEDTGNTDWTFVNEMYLLTAGTGLAAAGTLTLRNDAGSNNIGLIEAGNYQIHNCWWKVPANHTGYVYGFWGQVAAQATSVGGAYFALQIARHGLQGVASSETYETVAEMFVPEHDSDLAATTNGDSRGFFSFPGNVPFVVPAKAIVRLAAKSSSGSTAVSGGFQLVLQGSNAGTTVTDN